MTAILEYGSGYGDEIDNENVNRGTTSKMSECHVKLPDHIFEGEERVIKIKKHLTIGDLKERIYTVIGIPTHCQTLLAD